MDHVALYGDAQGRPALWLCQPYMRRGDPILGEIGAFAKAHGLSLVISDGWHHPNTLGLQFTASPLAR